MTKLGRIRRTACVSVYALATASLFLGASAQAQTSPASDQDAKPASEAASSVDPATVATANPADKDSEEIVVTGTNISGVKPVGNTSIVLTHEDAIKSGASTPADLLRTLPQQRASEYEVDAGSANKSLQNSGGQSTIDLRGFGSSGGRATTLLLIDGRRVVGFGTNQGGTEANQVPLAAIERIEVIADGASAVYGSDAVGGVVNYVMRKDYEGAELTFRGDNNYGGFVWGIDATAGTKWENGLGRGNLLVSYGYTHRDNYTTGKNPFLRYDATGVGGLDARLSNAAGMTGFVPNIIVDRGGGYINPVLQEAGQYDYYGLPDGTNAGLTFGDLRPQDPNLTDLSFYSDYVGKMRRHQVAVFANQELGDNVELFLQANYLNRETHTRQSQSSRGVTLNAFLYDPITNLPTATPNPYYISGIPGVLPGGGLSVQYATVKDRGFDRRTLGSDESYNITGGVKVRLPASWQAEAYYTFGRNKGCGYCLAEGYVNPTAFQYQVNIGAINPLSSAPLSDAQLATFSGSQKQFGHNGIDDAMLKFNGPLFALPGGTARAALGVERLKTFNWNHNTSVDGIDNHPTILTNRDNSYYHRTVLSAFGEIYVPIVGEDMDVPFAKRIVASAALRHDDYSDVDNTTNPKLGLTWDVNDQVQFYGSWGKSYVAPLLTDKNPNAYVSALPFAALPQPFGQGDPRLNPFCLPPLFFPPNGICLISNPLVIFGSNPAMESQHSTQWTLGTTIKPFQGFRLNLNYFNIDFRNKIVFPGSLGAFLGGIQPGEFPYGGYENSIIDINNPVTCSNSDLSTADPVLQEILSNNLYVAAGGVGSLATVSNFCGIQAVIDSRFTNLARSKTDGLDLDASWTGNVGEVVVDLRAAANIIFNNDEKVTKDSPSVSKLGNLGDPPNPLKFRSRSSIGATYRGFSGTLFANYYGKFTNDQNRTIINGPTGGPNSVRIDPYLTFDLNLGYFREFEQRQFGMLKGFRASATVLNVFDRDPQIIINKNGAVLEGRGSPFGRTFAFQLGGSF